MCNNCNNNWPGLLNLLSGRSSCCCGNGCSCGNACNRCGNNNNCGCYDAYYAAQYALTSNCGCNSCNSCNSCGCGCGCGNNNGVSPASANIANNGNTVFWNGNFWGCSSCGNNRSGCGCNSCGNNRSGCGCNSCGNNRSGCGCNSCNSCNSCGCNF